MTEPYTYADVELVTAATEQHHIDFGQRNADGNNPCVCGKWWDSADMPGWDEHMAEVAVAALAAGGRLLPGELERLRVEEGEVMEQHKSEEWVKESEVVVRESTLPIQNLRDTGLLWLINRVVFHPRGFTLGMVYTYDGEFLHWVLIGNGMDPWRFDGDEDEAFRKVEELFEKAKAKHDE